MRSRITSRYLDMRLMAKEEVATECDKLDEKIADMEKIKELRGGSLEIDVLDSAYESAISLHYLGNACNVEFRLFLQCNSDTCRPTNWDELDLFVIDITKWESLLP